MCSAQHRHVKPIKSHLLDKYDLNDFVKEYRDIIPRLLFIEVTKQFTNVDFRHFKTKYYDQKYCHSIFKALKWTIKLSDTQQTELCEQMVGEKFIPTIDESELAKIPPHPMSTQFDHLGKYSDFCKDIETNPFSVREDILLYLMRNEFWKPLMEILTLFDSNWTVKQMYQYFEVLNWFGHETTLLMKCVAGEILKMQAKQHLKVTSYVCVSQLCFLKCDVVYLLCFQVSQLCCLIYTLSSLCMFFVNLFADFRRNLFARFFCEHCAKKKHEEYYI